MKNVISRISSLACVVIIGWGLGGEPALGLIADDGDWSIFVDDFSGDWLSWAFITDPESEFGIMEHMFLNASFVRVGNEGPELYVSELLDVAAAVNTQSNRLFLSFGDPEIDPITVDIEYALNGSGGDGELFESSSVVKTVVITNASGDAIDLHWLEYTDLDLDNNSFNVSARLTETQPAAKNAITQADRSTVVGEVIAGPNPDHYAIAEFPKLIDLLEDPFADTLSDTVADKGFGDAEYAYQWDLALANDETVTLETTFSGGFVDPDFPGSSPANPVLPDEIDEDGTFIFVDVPNGTWVDPPTATGYVYEATSDGLFTAILAFPPGLDADGFFEVVVGDISLGIFDDSQSVFFEDFAATLRGLLIDGFGVESFTVLGIDPPVDPSDPRAFPLRVEFNVPTVNLTMTAIPEPASAVILIGLLSGVYGTRRRG